MTYDVTLNHERSEHAWFAGKLKNAISGFKYCTKRCFDTDSSRSGIVKVLKAVLQQAKKLNFELSAMSVDEQFWLFKLLVNKDGAGPWNGAQESAVQIDMDKRTVNIYSYANSIELAGYYDRKFGSIIPRDRKPADKSIIPFRIWRKGRLSALTETKKIKCPDFPSIVDNYTEAVVDKVNYVINNNKPDNDGKIILWQGCPGTGKTTAVRALARAWYHNLNASIELIVDPEQLFSDSNYMYEVLLSDMHSRDNYDDDMAEADYNNDSVNNKSNLTSDVIDVFKNCLSENERQNAKIINKTKGVNKINNVPSESDAGDEDLPLRLIVIEDHAEIFADNCRNTSGFGRFLNMTDGIIGAGSRSVFLLTANEDIDRIDSAITRPGRCLSVNEFNKFTKDEAMHWLEKKGKYVDLENNNYTLADMYALLNNNNEPKSLPSLSKSKIGFH